MVCRELGALRVKGKQQPVRIYQLIGEAGEAAATGKAEFVEHFHAGLVCYRARDWDGAITRFLLRPRPGGGGRRQELRRLPRVVRGAQADASPGRLGWRPHCDLQVVEWLQEPAGSPIHQESRRMRSCGSRASPRRAWANGVIFWKTRGSPRRTCKTTWLSQHFAFHLVVEIRPRGKGVQRPNEGSAALLLNPWLFDRDIPRTLGRDSFRKVEDGREVALVISVLSCGDVVVDRHEEVKGRLPGRLIPDLRERFEHVIEALAIVAIRRWVGECLDREEFAQWSNSLLSRSNELLDSAGRDVIVVRGRELLDRLCDC